MLPLLRWKKNFNLIFLLMLLVIMLCLLSYWFWMPHFRCQCYFIKCRLIINHVSVHFCNFWSVLWGASLKLLCIMSSKNYIFLVTVYCCQSEMHSKRGLVFQRIYPLIWPSSYSHVGLRTLTWGRALARLSACLMNFSSVSHHPHHPYRNLIPRRWQLVMVPSLNFPLVRGGSLLFYVSSSLLRGPGTHNERVKFWKFSYFFPARGKLACNNRYIIF